MPLRHWLSNKKGKLCIEKLCIQYIQKFYTYVPNTKFLFIDSLTSILTLTTLVSKTLKKIGWWSEVQCYMNASNMVLRQIIQSWQYCFWGCIQLNDSTWFILSYNVALNANDLPNMRLATITLVPFCATP